MILQKILFPHENICTETELYFRKKGCSIYEDLTSSLSPMIEEEQKKEAEKEAAAFDNSFLKVVFGGPASGGASLRCEDKKSDILTYIADETNKYGVAEGVLFSGKKQTLRLDTYFNSFSVFKWKKYTTLNNLSISLKLVGDFKIDIKNVIRQENENPVTILSSHEVHCNDIGDLCFDIPLDECNTGLIYVELTSLTDRPSVFFGGAFVTDESLYDETDLSPVKIAIAMCTYKREKYVERNINELSAHLLNNEESPLHNNLEIYIADNSQSLDTDVVAGDFVHVFPNKNLGGAGGFGRAMYEILQEKDKKEYTNIIMMDDDVKFDPHVFERLYMFLKLMKDEYKEAHIGGAMLELDRMWMQSESAGYWYPKGHTPIKYRYDLRNIKWILKNEIEDSINFTSWWFTCMPISVLRNDNLPLPIFIKRDDIEYSIRTGKQLINLNGISVWHEAFDNKKNPALDYYYYRNMMILNARHREKFGLSDMLDFLDEIKLKINDDVNKYLYKEAHIKLKGIDDFLKGIDWLKKQDAEILNNVIFNRYSYKFEDISELNNRFIHGLWERSVTYKEKESEKNKRINTNNGWNSWSWKGTVYSPVKNPPEGLVCGAERVIYYDEITQKGFVTHKSPANREAVYKHFDQTRNDLINNFTRVKKEYNERFEEITNVQFWEDYLFNPAVNTDIPVEWWEKVADIPEYRVQKAKKELEQYNLEIEEQKKRVKDYPIVPNRVVFYLYQRHGFTCNVKYIMQELIKEAGDKLDIIWVSDYPETCDKVRKMGIRVVKGGTKEHWECHFTARVNVTSDCQPPYFYKRPDQTAITAWHGGISYKVIGFECLGASTDEELEIYGMKNRQPDCWLSGSQRFTDDTSEGFRHDKDVFLPTGMARNDVFFTDQSEMVRRVKKELGIPLKTKVAMYAPTFRRGGKHAGEPFDIKAFKTALKDKWGGDWLLLYRGHYFMKDNPKLDALDVSQYEDMQELMCITDVLVSDYSSCMWDFSFTKRPIFVYATDLDKFEYNDRGFYLPPETWPFPIATTSDGLCENVVDFDEKDYEEKIDLHHKTEGAFEKGTSAKTACDIIKKACNV